MQGRMRGCEFQPLEKRLLFAAAPAGPRADSLGKAFDAGERQVLLDSLTNLPATTRSTLQSKLKKSVGQFDSALLSYMRTRSGPNFFFDPAKTDQIGSFIANNDISITDVQANADAVADSHLFPQQNSAADYTVHLPASIDWVSPGGSSNPEFLHSKN